MGAGAAMSDLLCAGEAQRDAEQGALRAVADGEPNLHRETHLRLRTGPASACPSHTSSRAEHVKREINITMGIKNVMGMRIETAGNVEETGMEWGGGRSE